jgi:predicted pyridoxine 5'-phosphate oxidase superfamily flavin-nucleotide-binding protein
MTAPVSDIAFTPAVKALQARNGSRKAYERMEQKGGWKDEVTPDLAAFLAERDSFYLATASGEGRPYIQHRGGPKGFLKVLDGKRLAFADFGGNRQYISAGNLSENDQASIFLMDYANRQRIKLWGRARVVEDDPELLERLVEPGYKAKPERAIVFEIEAWDVNCPQHITRRYSEEQIAPAMARLQARIEELEAEVEALRGA